MKRATILLGTLTTSGLSADTMIRQLLRYCSPPVR